MTLQYITDGNNPSFSMGKPLEKLSSSENKKLLNNFLLIIQSVLLDQVSVTQNFDFQKTIAFNDF